MPETITNNKIKYLNGNPYIEYRLSLKYTNKYGVPLPEIADGLLALQTQVDFLPYSLNRTIKCKGIRGLKIEKSIVKLTKLESGSLIEDFIVMLFFISNSLSASPAVAVAETSVSVLPLPVADAFTGNAGKIHSTVTTARHNAIILFK